MIALDEEACPEGKLSSIDRHLACKVTRAIEEAGMSPEEAAERLGLTLEDYLAVEQAKVRIGAFLVARIASLSGKSIEWFFKGLPGQHFFDRE